MTDKTNNKIIHYEPKTEYDADEYDKFIEAKRQEFMREWEAYIAEWCDEAR